VDVVATLGKPITLAALLDETRRITSEMLGLTTVPDLGPRTMVAPAVASRWAGGTAQ
jgi:hypothetical protein